VEPCDQTSSAYAEPNVGTYGLASVSFVVQSFETCYLVSGAGQDVRTSGLTFFPEISSMVELSS
jgi:hypothetical protein